MKLGAFSVSLAVKSLSKSLEFYSKLGFESIGGDEEHYAILRNGDAIVGLFQGMFEKNILTFNPGWDLNQKVLEEFTDVRDLCAALKEQGLVPTSENVGESESGPAHFALIDPDGNPVLVDQHVGS